MSHPILNFLAYRQIVSFERDGDGNFTVEECCDNYHKTTLTSDHLKKLAQELIDLADGKTPASGLTRWSYHYRGKDGIATFNDYGIDAKTVEDAESIIRTKHGEGTLLWIGLA